MENIMPIIKMTCPSCNHTYNLPSKEAKAGFKKCPKCGQEKLKEYQCHVCKVGIGEKHLPFCSVGFGFFGQGVW